MAVKPSGRSRRAQPLPAAQRVAIERYVDSCPQARPTVADLAAVVGLPAEQLSRRFRVTFGLPARSWLPRRRIRAAADRLGGGDDPVSVVAAAFGYPDVFGFSRQFKAVTGLSPRAWRERG